MSPLAPSSAAEFAAVLAELARQGRTIQIVGNNSKLLMGGPLPEPATVVSTTGLRNILRYEPNDLTISVEAGMPFAELQAHLRQRGQMIALDAPFSGSATVGGIVASNTSGPLRCAFGTARDQVIGMTFATLEGKLASSGGMVVKNVAGLDMCKMMIGSFGTLAVMTSINFRLHPRPNGTRTFFATFADLQGALAARDHIKTGPLQPFALELLTPAASARVGQSRYLLALMAGGSPRILDRYQRELPGFRLVPPGDEPELWRRVRHFTPDFLRDVPDGIVLRISTPLQEMAGLLSSEDCASVSHAATGVTHVHLANCQRVAPLWRTAAEHGWPACVEFAPPHIRKKEDLWLLSSEESTQNTFTMMKRVKEMFDPGRLLNPGRLYGRI